MLQEGTLLSLKCIGKKVSYKAKAMFSQKSLVEIFLSVLFAVKVRA